MRSRASQDTLKGAEELSLREILTQFDVPCSSCGYNLRGCVGDVCPECARAISLDGARSFLAHQQWRATHMPTDRWTVIGAFVGYGISIGIVLPAAIVRGVEGQVSLAIVLPGLAIAALVQSPFVLLFVVRSARAELWDEKKRRWLAIAAWALAPTAEIVFIVAYFLVYRGVAR